MLEEKALLQMNLSSWQAIDILGTSAGHVEAIYAVKHLTYFLQVLYHCCEVHGTQCHDLTVTYKSTRRGFPQHRFFVRMKAGNLHHVADFFTTRDTRGAETEILEQLFGYTDSSMCQPPAGLNKAIRALETAVDENVKRLKTAINTCGLDDDVTSASCTVRPPYDPALFDESRSDEEDYWAE